MNAARDLEKRIAETIRKRGIRPATDAQMAAKEAEIQGEWRERKAEIMLGRLDYVYRSAKTRHPESAQWLADYVSGNRHGYVLLGDPGCGKTWEAAALARTLMVEHTVPVTVVNASTLMEALKPNRDGSSDLGQFQVAPVLVLDDLGAERATDWALGQMYLLAEYRNVRRLPTIITSNLSGAALRERYTDRIIDRLIQNSSLLVMPKRQFRATPF